MGAGRAINALPFGDDAQRLAALRQHVQAEEAHEVLLEQAGRDGGFPVLYREDKPEQFVIDWMSLFKNVADPEAPLTPGAAFLAAGLTRALPQNGGSAICALRAATKAGGYYNQLSLLDAFFAQ